MNVANVARVLVVTGACFAAVGSATSNTTQPATTDPTQAQFESASGGAGSTPPAARQMEGTRALGLWRSTFGAVKIEADPARGGLQAGSVQGIWIYQRQGRQVIGDFGGELRGNVLQFHWREPGLQPTDAPLVGDGYLVFEPSGRQYSGRWWSERHDRQGDWNGWRQDAQRGGQPEGNSGEAQPSLNGTYPAGQPYPPQGQQPYPPPQQGQGQPYPPQGQPYPPPPQGQPYLPAPQGGPTYYPPQGQPQPYQPPPYQPPPQQQPQQPPQRGYY